MLEISNSRIKIPTQLKFFKAYNLIELIYSPIKSKTLIPSNQHPYLYALEYYNGYLMANTVIHLFLLLAIVADIKV